MLNMFRNLMTWHHGCGFRGCIGAVSLGSPTKLPRHKEAGGLWGKLRRRNIQSPILLIQFSIFGLLVNVLSVVSCNFGCFGHTGHTLVTLFSRRCDLLRYTIINDLRNWSHKSHFFPEKKIIACTPLNKCDLCDQMRKLFIYI